MKINRGYTRSVRLSISDDRGAIFGAGNVHSGFLLGLGILGISFWGLVAICNLN
jgi:hypothetical protein